MNSASASASSLRFSSMLTTTWVGSSSRIRSIFTSLVPPTFGIVLTVSQGWMQKPVRPTSCSDRPRSQSSSVMLGTRQTMRAAIAET